MDRPQSGRRHRLDLDLLAQGRVQQIGHVDDHLVGVDRLRRQRLLAGEGEKPLRQRRRALGGRGRGAREALDAEVAPLRCGARRDRGAPMITPSILLKSCAMPPVSWPSASIFCACRSWLSAASRRATCSTSSLLGAIRRSRAVVSAAKEFAGKPRNQEADTTYEQKREGNADLQQHGGPRRGRLRGSRAAYFPLLHGRDLLTDLLHQAKAVSLSTIANASS